MIVTPTFTSGLYRCTRGMTVFQYPGYGLGLLLIRGYRVSLLLRGLSWKSGIAFLNIVVVLRRDFDNHMVNLSDVLR